MISNNINLPQAIQPLIDLHACILSNVLSDKLSGIYIHGSVALGSFNPEQSDFDYLVLISEPLTSDERANLSTSFKKVYGQHFPGNGVEMTIMEERFAGKGFIYPTPYEYHFGTLEQIDQFAHPLDKEVTDYDLAAHFAVLQKRGICYFGKPINEVFSISGHSYYLDSIIRDSEWSHDCIMSKTPDEPCLVPHYGVLNFCRVMAAQQDDVILSKKEGGEWGLKEIPENYHPIIKAALQEYAEKNSSHEVNGVLLKEYTDYMWRKIQPNPQEPVSNLELS